MTVIKALFGAVLGGGAGFLAALALFLPVWFVAGIVTNSERAAERIAGNVGSMLVILGAIIGFILPFSEQVKKMRDEARQKRARAEEERRREAANCDFVKMDEAYERMKDESKRIDMNHLKGYVTHVLGGGDVGSNEFERREFSRHRDAKIRDVENKLFMLRVNGYAHIAAYDFEKGRFPVHVSLHDDLTVIHGFSSAGREQTRASDGFIAIDEERAKRLREADPKVDTVEAIVRASRMNPGVRVELMGLRLHVKTRHGTHTAAKIQ
jgi:hypothetical protein